MKEKKRHEASIEGDEALLCAGNELLHPEDVTEKSSTHLSIKRQASHVKYLLFLV
jgi:hypothetical protein